MCGRTESWILGVGLSSWLHIGSKGSPILSLNSWSCSPSVYLWFFSRRDKCHQFSSSFVWEPPVWVDGVKRSGGRHYLPPARQASQSFFNKEYNLQLSGRRLFPPSVGNQDNSPTGRTFGRVSPLCENLASLPWGSSLLRRTGRLASVIADEDLPLDLKQGTPWTSNHGAGGIVVNDTLVF